MSGSGGGRCCCGLCGRCVFVALCDVREKVVAGGGRARCCGCFLVLAIACWRHPTVVAIARTASPVAVATPLEIVAACCCAAHWVFWRSVAISCLASSLRAARGGSCGCWRGVAVRVSVHR